MPAKPTTKRLQVVLSADLLRAIEEAPPQQEGAFGVLEWLK
jgi:hypothetical protein